MMAPGHVALGLATYQGLCMFFGYQPEAELFTLAAVGSLLPDIDHPKSQVGRLFPNMSQFLANTFGHRGFTHSLLAVFLFVFLAFQFGRLGGGAVGALSIGYLSHLFGDFCTKTGIPLFWPMRYTVRLPYLNFRTNGPVEHVLTVLMVAVVSYRWVY